MVVAVTALAAVPSMVPTAGPARADVLPYVPWSTYLPGWTDEYIPSSDNDCVAGRPACLKATLAELARTELCAQHRLEGFSEEEVERFLAARGRDVPRRLVARLRDRTRGNPFFLHHAALWLEQRALWDAAVLGASFEIQIPPAVRDVLAGRLAQLTPRARRTLAIAALIVMVGRVPVGQALTVGLPEAFQIPTWANWLLEWPQNAAKRGIAIGAGLGLMATGLRIILGIERSYMRDEG